jgi:CheY-like chemotaxis protein
MKDGGMLRISASNVVLDGRPDGLRGEHVALRVSDTGTGMAPGTMERVFEPFFTTKGYGEGTGLGLSQVFGFAKQIGGAITVESKPGEGSTFTLYLPIGHTAPRRDEDRDLSGGDTDRGAALIVEDDMVVAELAAAIFDELGFRPTVVHSAKEALERLTAAERPRLVFSDIVMPGGISGLELARKVRGRFPELPILLTTGYSEQGSASHGFPVLTKPYEFDTLAAALGKLLQDNPELH